MSPTTVDRFGGSGAETWQPAIESFLKRWCRRREVAGALVCGSYITGDASPRSDLDLQIVLAEGTRWQERGNAVVDGYLVEYFANSPARTRHYFDADRARNRLTTATMFVTGRMLFDTGRTVALLIRDATRCLRRPFRKLAAAEIERLKYAAWDSLDNLRDLGERGVPLTHAYHEHLQSQYSDFARFLRQPVLPASQLARYLTDSGFRAKYRLGPFPEPRFRGLLLAALDAGSRAAQLRSAERLTHHAIRRMGGFEIDGWRHRTRLVET